MKVGELLTILNDYEDDVEIILASDDEWNVLRPLHGVDESPVLMDEHEISAVNPDDMYDYDDETVNSISDSLVLW